MSLRRAFHMAGVRSVVSSLWKVDDTATAQLMQNFYRGLWIAGLHPAEALRKAQLQMLANSRQGGRRADPSQPIISHHGDVRRTNAC